MNFEKTKKLIKIDENFRAYPYDDATGLPVKAPVGKITLGWGWNIQDHPISNFIADYILDTQIKSLFVLLCEKISFFKDLNDSTQYVLINIAFNCGVNGLLNFKKMLKAISDNNFVLASKELMDSDAARKLNNRYSRLSDILLFGRWSGDII